MINEKSFTNLTGNSFCLFVCFGFFPTIFFGKPPLNSFFQTTASEKKIATPPPRSEFSGSALEKHVHVLYLE